MKKLIAVQFAILILTISAMGFAATYTISSSHAASSANIHKVRSVQTDHDRKRSQSWRH